MHVDGSGCYGMNGHEDAAADAAILSRAVGRPVRVQWMREDELGWDTKGPPQLIGISGSVAPDGRILDWRTELWIPKTTRGMPNIPLLAPEAAGLDHVPGHNPGLISQNGDPSYEADSIQVIAHWLKDAPLRPAPIRSPGEPANCCPFWRSEIMLGCCDITIKFLVSEIDDWGSSRFSRLPEHLDAPNGLMVHHFLQIFHETVLILRYFSRPIGML